MKIPSANDPEIQKARRISKRLLPWIEPQKLSCISTDRVSAGLTIDTFVNDDLEIRVKRFDSGWPLGGGRYAEIGICWSDGGFNHDWRTFQWIKNCVVGKEWDAVELYPAESRLIDPSNYYILWACPSINLGMRLGRRIIGADFAIAPQRPFYKLPEDAKGENWWK